MSGCCEHVSWGLSPLMRRSAAVSKTQSGEVVEDAARESGCWGHHVSRVSQRTVTHSFNKELPAACGETRAKAHMGRKVSTCSPGPTPTLTFKASCCTSWNKYGHQRPVGGSSFWRDPDTDPDASSWAQERSLSLGPQAQGPGPAEQRGFLQQAGDETLSPRPSRGTFPRARLPRIRGAPL